MGEKKTKSWPNLNAYIRSNNWDEHEFVQNKTNLVMEVGPLMPQTRYLPNIGPYLSLMILCWMGWNLKGVYHNLLVYE